MSSVEESPAQRAARLRRERREAKIKGDGAARLDKITSLSGRTPASRMYHTIQFPPYAILSERNKDNMIMKLTKSFLLRISPRRNLSLSLSFSGSGRSTSYHYSTKPQPEPKPGPRIPNHSTFLPKPSPPATARTRPRNAPSTAGALPRPTPPVWPAWRLTQRKPRTPSRRTRRYGRNGRSRRRSGRPDAETSLEPNGRGYQCTGRGLTAWRTIARGLTDWVGSSAICGEYVGRGDAEEE